MVAARNKSLAAVQFAVCIGHTFLYTHSMFFQRSSAAVLNPRRAVRTVLHGALALAALAAFTAPPPAQAQDGDLGVIEGRARAEYRIRVTSPDNATERLAQTAFGLHGGYELRSGGDVHFHFDFEPVGERRVELRIRSGGQELLRRTVDGRDSTHALMRAADYAVQRTLDIPGFFAGTIAFISTRTGASEVYVSDMLFQNARQLTRDRAKALLPTLSPDGNTVLYTSYYRNDFPDLYKIDLRNNRRTVFAGFRGTNTGANFSPDGRRVAMVLSGSGNAEIYVGDADGRNLRRLTHTEALEADPAWSPDGRRLVFASDAPGRPQIFTMDASGGGRPTRVPTDISRHCTEPSWNPVDDDKIAFTAAMAGQFVVCVYSFRERRSEVVTRGAGDAVHPAWLRDGRHLLFNRRTSTANYLMVLDTHTGKTTRLSPSGFARAYQADYRYVE